jgi:eukaryotic-like serine/threonine-protein kinase
VGTILAGRYRIIQVLGSGGMGHVYLAERRPPGDRVAVKVMRAERRRNASLVARFEREASAASRIHHPNVLEAHEVERLPDGSLCFAMELLVGLDLADTLAYQRVLGAARAVGVASGIAEGLAAAHAAGVIHRDVKPENVFLVHAPDGREVVKLLDFGFAWMPGDETRDPAPASGDRAVVGTPEYIAPEQARGAPAAPGADIYSLGIVLYEMLAGRVPFAGTYPAIAELHASRPPPPLGQRRPGVVVSRALEAVVERGLAKDPADRFPTATAFRDALRAVPEAAPGASSHPPAR